MDELSNCIQSKEQVLVVVSCVVSCHALLCSVVSCCVAPCRVVLSCRVVLCCAVSCRVVSCSAVTCHVLWCGVLPCCIASVSCSITNQLNPRTTKSFTSPQFFSGSSQSLNFAQTAAKPCHLFLSWATSVKYLSSYCFNIQYNIVFPSTPRSSKWAFAFAFPFQSSPSFLTCRTSRTVL